MYPARRSVKTNSGDVGGEGGAQGQVRRGRKEPESDPPKDIDSVFLLVAFLDQLTQGFPLKNEPDRSVCFDSDERRLWFSSPWLRTK